MNRAILTVTIKQERDVVAVRRRVRQIAELLGFDRQDNTRIATAVSEIARNAFDYADGGKVEFIIESETARQTLLIRISDRGRGIENLSDVLNGEYKSPTGMGLGIIGSQRLMDDFKIESSVDSGTMVWLRKKLPKFTKPIDAARLREIADALVQKSADNPLEEVQEQNQELLQILYQLRERQEDLLRLNRELEDTNRGVVALYAELDQTAEDLRRADAAKTAFLANMSHEFRTPLNSQLALTRILLDRTDGELSAEQEKQIRLVRRGTETLLDLVNDLLDLAKIAAGKAAVRAEEFTVKDLFSALRGMVRPLLVSDQVQLIFDEPDPGVPTLFTDEGKVAQILRNFLSNALKFTVRGEVRVSVKVSADQQTVVFAVADTGIGIETQDQARIFEEFTQLENPLQKNQKGTGLGLPLSRKLAELLGGSVTVTSALGIGTTFCIKIPCVFGNHSNAAQTLAEPRSNQLNAPANAARILVIDDDESARYVLQKMLDGAGFEIVEAASGTEGITLAQRLTPCLICLDLAMPEMNGAEVLRRLKADAQTAAIPVIVITSQDFDECREFESAVAALLGKKDLTADKLQTIVKTALNVRGEC